MEKKVVIQGCFYQGSTNIKKMKEVYFSIRRCKFVKPLKRYGDRVAGFFEYQLLPATYIRFSFYKWNKAEPQIDFAVEIVRVEENGNVEVLKNVVVKADTKEEILNVIKTQCSCEIVKDFLLHIPSYHSKPDVKTLTEKIYDESQLKQLREFIERNNGRVIYANVENE